MSEVSKIIRLEEMSDKQRENIKQLVVEQGGAMMVVIHPLFCFGTAETHWAYEVDTSGSTELVSEHPMHFKIPGGSYQVVEPDGFQDFMIKIGGNDEAAAVDSMHSLARWYLLRLEKYVGNLANLLNKEELRAALICPNNSNYEETIEWIKTNTSNRTYVIQTHHVWRDDKENERTQDLEDMCSALDVFGVSSAGFCGSFYHPKFMETFPGCVAVAAKYLKTRGFSGPIVPFENATFSRMI